ncbi:MAG TPA: glycosyltransferase family 2 protein [Bryobacteraceae bacterium]|jgi:dolichol-phosphate mannosyltransferase
MRILVAVPVFNEEKYVGRVLREIRKYSRAAAVSEASAGRPVEIRVLVIDDGSTDGTSKILREMAQLGHIELLTHPENRGYGQSLIDAFRFAAGATLSHERRFDWVITLDCDEQHEPCRIPLFVRECLKDDADIISGSRYLRPDWQSNGHGAPPEDRRHINRVITELLNRRLELNVEESRRAGDFGSHSNASEKPGITDAFCGFKAHRISAMERMRLTIPGYAFPMQFWAQASALALRIRELPVKLIYKDATRHFGGLLDDPAVRLQHYLEVLEPELQATGEAAECAPGGSGFDAECAFAFDR